MDETREDRMEHGLETRAKKKGKRKKKRQGTFDTAPPPVAEEREDGLAVLEGGPAPLGVYSEENQNVTHEPLMVHRKLECPKCGGPSRVDRTDKSYRTQLGNSVLYRTRICLGTCPPVGMEKGEEKRPRFRSIEEAIPVTEEAPSSDGASEE